MPLATLTPQAYFLGKAEAALRLRSTVSHAFSKKMRLIRVKTPVSPTSGAHTGSAHVIPIQNRFVLSPSY